jgi:cytochrome P450
MASREGSMSTTRMRERALASLGSAARHVPNDNAQLFAFVTSPSVRARPWPLYQRLHRHRPVRPVPYGAWMVASHAGVSQVLRLPATSVDESRAVGLPPVDATGSFSTLMSRTLLFTDPPDHARLRSLVSRAFTPRTVEALRPRIEAMVAEKLAELHPLGSADLVAELARPLPVAVICELLGVPARERSRFLGWAQSIAPRLDLSLIRDAAKERAGDQAAEELTEFLDELVADPRRRHPDGLLAGLAEVEVDGDQLRREEVTALGALLLLAGAETTTNLIASGLLSLLDHPDQLARVRDADVAPESAVEELLRYDGPVQMTQRVLLEPTDLQGHQIPAQTLLILLIGAANRDPSVFAEPDVLDVGREPNRQLAFSLGIHHCIGAALARLEAAVTIPAVLRAWPDLRLTSRPRQRDTFVLRGLSTLPVGWST